MAEETKLEPATQRRKRYSVVWKGRRINFGAEGAETFADGASESKRAAYLARHGAPSAGEKWDDPSTAGFWARWVLWEKKRPRAGFSEALEKAKGR